MDAKELTDNELTDKAVLAETVMREIGRQVTDFCNNMSAVFKQYSDLLCPTGCAIELGVTMLYDVKTVMIFGNGKAVKMAHEELTKNVEQGRR